VDTVEITESARQMAALAQAVKDTPEVDSKRVAALQQAIESGQYSIDPARIADGIVQFEKNLGVNG
jgi:negative regulator of flagellin synthesis FlgM